MPWLNGRGLAKMSSISVYCSCPNASSLYIFTVNLDCDTVIRPLISIVDVFLYHISSRYRFYILILILNPLILTSVEVLRD